MKILYVICASLFCSSAFAWNKCTLDSDSGLWVKNYQCDEQSVQAGHELFNDSLNQNGQSSYAEIDNKPNTDFLKQHQAIKDALD